METCVLFADESGVACQSPCTYLAPDAELEVVGDATNTAEALWLAHEAEPDVVLMSLSMTAIDGIAATGASRRPTHFLPPERSREVVWSST
jgi:chemotaxis response regulator CheB